VDDRGVGAGRAAGGPCRCRVTTMRDEDRRFDGEIPEPYDRFLGPILFTPVAKVVAERAASGAPERVLEPRRYSLAGS
jgi:hypothetical protein